MDYTAVVTAAVAGNTALLGAVVGAGIQARSTHSQWLIESRLVACQHLMDAYQPLYGNLALSRRGKVFDQSWTEWNAALSSVSFVCAPSVVDAAYSLDEQLWRADWAIRGGHVGQGEWSRIRGPVDDAHSALVQEIRHQTSKKDRAVVRTSGRPRDDDPMWSERDRTEQDRRIES